MKNMIISLLGHFPWLKKFLKGVRNYVLPNSNVSTDYVALGNAEAGSEADRLRNAWQDEDLPLKQRDLVDQQLRRYRSGAAIDVFDVLLQALRELPELQPEVSLLEVGCSSGFYSEVLEISKLPIQYSGCDYSAAFIQLAREKYPLLDFSVADATQLDYQNDSFDIVVSGCCLLHIPEYVKGIEETARVARRFAIFHRTPIVWGQAEQWYRKKAYGVETVEIHFNETEFLNHLEKSGLELLTTYTLSEENQNTAKTIGRASRTYVCRKKDQ